MRVCLRSGENADASGADTLYALPRLFSRPGDGNISRDEFVSVTEMMIIDYVWWWWWEIHCPALAVFTCVLARGVGSFVLLNHPTCVCLFVFRSCQIATMKDYVETMTDVNTAAVAYDTTVEEVER